MSTADQQTQQMIENPMSSVATYELPIGYLDPEGNIHTTVEIREMTGYEEDILASKSMPPAKKMGELMARCVEAVGAVRDKDKIRQILKKLTIGDRTFLIFAIRRATFGDECPFDWTCPSCSETGTYRVNLGEFTIKNMEDPTKRQFTVTTPKGRTIIFKTLTGEDEALMERAAKNTKDALSLALMTRIVQIDGQPASLPAIKSFSMADRNFIRNKFEEMDGGVDTSMDMVCKSCMTETKSEFDFQSGFFFPSE